MLLHFIQYPIPAQEVGNASVTPLDCPWTTVTSSGRLHARLPLDNVIRKIRYQYNRSRPTTVPTAYPLLLALLPVVLQCHLWIEACRRPDLRDKNVDQLYNMHVCGLHFEGWMYMKKKLKSAAIPVLNLPSPMYIEILSRAPPNSSPYASTQQIGAQAEIKIVKDLHDKDVQRRMDTVPVGVASFAASTSAQTWQTTIKLSENTPRKRKLLKQIMTCTKKLKFVDDTKPTTITRQQFLQGCDKFLSPSLSRVVKAQTDLKPYSRSNKYSKEFKLFCLNIYSSSPRAYKFLSSTLGLPSKRNLVTTAIPVGTKISDYVWGVLSQAVKCLAPRDRECTFCMDVTNLKSSLFYDAHRDKVVGLYEVDDNQNPYAAGFAFAIMLKGILADWRQVVGYAFVTTNKVDEQLKRWIINTIKKLLELGFKIRAVVSDLGSGFLNFSNSVKVSKDQPYFQIDDKRIYYIFDVAHLMKSIRNTFMNHDFEFNGKTASWDDIHKCYQIEKQRDYRIATKLTDSHISPKKFQMRKTRLAVQVLSESVKAALTTHTKAGNLNPRDGTIEFIDTVDKLFDLLNSTNLYSPKTYKKPYRGGESQRSLLLEADRLLNSLIVRHKNNGEDVTTSIRFINALSITINAMMRLYDDLKKESGSNELHLLTRRLTNEGLENFLGLIRRAGGKRGSASPIQFERAFRKSFLCQIFVMCDQIGGGEDFNEVLSKYGDFVKKEPLFPSGGGKESHPTRRTLSSNFHIPKRNSFLYICSYILRRCVKKHRCSSMIDYLASYTDESTATNNARAQDNRCRATRGSFDGLQVPPSDFVEYCIELELGFKKNFSSFALKNFYADQIAGILNEHPKPKSLHEKIDRCRVKRERYALIDNGGSGRRQNAFEALNGLR
ncbi:DNA transposase THAP9 [Eumeta japonica]|uniref:DNA transposase THAP9 n=1 Tax=Eumeta variegata TaxID=151549 RepID=A0A4C1VCW5_EUMVA|nr:DNA transposase THAP9 [Eumeta japonica]